MWVAKLKNWHKDCLIRPHCIKYKITDFVYLINSWTDAKNFYYTELHILQGTVENQKKFIQAFKKTKGIKKFEVQGNHIITLNIEPLTKQFYSPIFDRRLIYLRPVAQRADGYEEWYVASWDREVITSLLKVPTFAMRLISIRQEKFMDMFMPQIYPKLSPKQKEAIELAVHDGYYDYPKKIYLEDLAKRSKIKRQTFEEHLRRAEHKLVPFLTEGFGLND